MLDPEYQDSVLYRLLQGGVDAPVGMIVAAIAAQKNTVMQRAAEFVASSPDPAVQSLLQKSSSTLTLTSGQVAKPTDALTKYLPNAQITVSDGGSNIWPEPAEWIGTVFDLLNPPPIFDYIFFTCHNGLLKFRQYTQSGAVVPVMNGVTLNKVDMVYQYIPTVGDIALTDDVADIVFDTAVALYLEVQIQTAAKAEAN